MDQKELSNLDTSQSHLDYSQYEINFYPKDIKDLELKEIFCDRRAYKIWCLIKLRHFEDVSPFFNYHVLNFARSIETGYIKKNYMLTYEQFICMRGNLGEYGTKVVTRTVDCVDEIHLDHDFWRHMYEVVMYNKPFTVITSIPHDNDSDSEIRTEFNYTEFMQDIKDKEGSFF